MRTFTGALTAGSALLLAAACQSEVREQQPEETVALFIERMSAVHGDGKAARDAYQLLWSGAKRNLIERAKRASAVAGRTVAPEEMIAPSRFSLVFKPLRYETRLLGSSAEVTAIGEASDSERYTTKCVREEGQWRVVVELPPLPPIQRRLDVADE